MSDHHDGTRFFNPGQPTTDRSLRELLRWRLLGTRTRWPAHPEPGQSTPLPTPRPAPRSETPVVTMIGHASLLIQAENLNILIDPVWSDRASPLRFAGPKRWDRPGVAFDDLPPIDAVLLTHNHYDHFDLRTLKALVARHNPRIIAPLRNDATLATIQTADWGDRIPLSDHLAVTLHPAYHWSARGPTDRRRALWSGYVIETPAGPIYAAGDTAYGDGAPFHLVKHRFGPPLLAILPIGAYEPRWFMKNQHVNPSEAVRIFQDCAARHAIGIHWGTFNLTDEPQDAPPMALHQACLNAGIDPARFAPARPGDVWSEPYP